MHRKNKRQDSRQQTLFDCARQYNQADPNESRLNGNLDQLEITERENYVRLTSQLTDLEQKRMSCIQRLRRIETKKAQRDCNDNEPLLPTSCRYTTEVSEHVQESEHLLFGLARSAFANISEQYGQNDQSKTMDLVPTDALGMKKQLESTAVHQATHDACQTGQLPSAFLQGYCHSFPSVLRQLGELDLSCSLSTESTAYQLPNP